MRLGGKEGIKNLLCLLWRQTHAGIADRDQHMTILGALRLDGDLARPIHVFHRVDAVHHKVHQHLLQLHAISHDPGNIFRKLRPDGYGIRRRLALSQPPPVPAERHRANHVFYAFAPSLPGRDAPPLGEALKYRQL